MKTTNHAVKSPIDTKYDVRIELQGETNQTQTTFNTKLSVSCLLSKTQILEKYLQHNHLVNAHNCKYVSWGDPVKKF